MEYYKQVDAPRLKSNWHHKKAQYYQMRMKRRPTRAERRFNNILDQALKGFDFSLYKPTQTKKYESKRKFKKQRIFEDYLHKKAYIVDFFIPEINLAFEIDGSSHDRQKDY